MTCRCWMCPAAIALIESGILDSDAQLVLLAWLLRWQAAGPFPADPEREEAVARFLLGCPSSERPTAVNKLSA